MSTGTSTEVETWLRANPVLTPAQEVVAKFARAIAIEATIDDGTTDPAVLEIMGNILSATDEDAIFAAANAGTTPGKNFTNVPFALRSDGISYKLSASMFREQGNFPFYALLRIVNGETGEPQVLNCGGYGFLTTLWRLGQVNYFTKPRPELDGKSFDDVGGAMFVLTEKPTASGFSVLLLKPFKMPRVAAPHAASES